MLSDRFRVYLIPSLVRGLFSSYLLDRNSLWLLMDLFGLRSLSFTGSWGFVFPESVAREKSLPFIPPAVSVFEEFS